jgi:DNA-binding PucR family transcriptional regulator
MTAVFYPVADDASLANIRWVAERFCNDLAGSLPITGYRAGVSRRHAGASEYPAAYREATRTLDLGLALNLPSTVVCHADLGIHRLLLAASASEDLSEMHEELLGALARYDQTTNSDLVPTLAAYLATGNAVEVAKRLNVHRNTLRYRLQRIREITGADLDDPEVRLTLHLALKISDVISVTQRAS